MLYFFFHDSATTEIYTLSLHDALPIALRPDRRRMAGHRHAGTLRPRLARARARLLCGGAARIAAAARPFSGGAGGGRPPPRGPARGRRGAFPARDPRPLRHARARVPR